MLSLVELRVAQPRVLGVASRTPCVGGSLVGSSLDVAHAGVRAVSAELDARIVQQAREGLRH